MMPGPGFQKEGLFFDQRGHHNIPGYLDNVMVGLLQAFILTIRKASSEHCKYCEGCKPLNVWHF